MVKRITLSIFPAFHSRNYRLYFIGQLVSQIGNWLQIVAQGWLVLILTNSPLLVGLVAAMATLPTFLFALIGGVIVDRFNKTRLIIVTNSISLVLALILGTLTILQLINVVEIIILAFLLGIVITIDRTARQAYVTELVEEEYVASAIALNAAIFNGGRLLGPSLAGLLIAFIGIGGTFIVNAITFLPAIIVQFLVRPFVLDVSKNKRTFSAIKEGLNYTLRHPYVKALVALTAIVSVFGWSYMAILPVVAKNVFNSGAAELGYLFAASGLGGILATFNVSYFSSKFSPYFFIIGGIFIYAVSMLGFSFTTDLYFGYLFMFFSGFGLLSAFSIINAQILGSASPVFRGRVISVYHLMFMGLFPFGNFLIGFLSEHLGSQIGLRITSSVVLVAIIIFYLLRGKIKAARKRYLQEHNLI